VGRRAHRLDVVVTVPKPSYQVRETVPVSVRVSRQGRPVAGAEVAFAAVDEGLLALAPNRSWQLLEGLLVPRAWGVATATAQGEIVGRRHYGRKAVPAGGGGGANATRELFDTLLLWRGRVQLDANGEARIDVPLNDSLTRFRLVAIADAGDGFFGSGEATVAVSQDLQLLPGLAPLARAGDRFEAGFTVRNTTARPMALKVAMQLQAEGEQGPIAVPALPPQTLQLAPGAAQELRWPVRCPAAGGCRPRWRRAWRWCCPSCTTGSAATPSTAWSSRPRARWRWATVPPSIASRPSCRATWMPMAWRITSRRRPEARRRATTS
jgi:uncharacterized protein YfaS (alpha-2-macroglobulin family)